MVYNAISESLPALSAAARSCVSHEKYQLGFSAFLKNNTSAQPPWQEIVDVSKSSGAAYPRRRVILSRALSLAGTGGSFGAAGGGPFAWWGVLPRFRRARPLRR